MVKPLRNSSLAEARVGSADRGIRACRSSGNLSPQRFTVGIARHDGPLLQKNKLSSWPQLDEYCAMWG